MFDIILSKNIRSKYYGQISIQNIIEKEQKYIEKMEKDSIALINQRTTISKQRIFKDTVRRNVKISSESLNLIDK